MINLDREPPKATIAWVASHGVDPESPIVEAMEAAGYRIVSAGAPGKIDIAAVDLREIDNLKTIQALAAGARRPAPAAGLILIASRGVDAGLRAEMRRCGEVCWVRRENPAALVAAVRDRLRLAALADEMGERIKSLVADGRQISFRSFSRDRSKLSVLVAGKPSPLMLGACNAVRGVSGETVSVFGAGHVMRALDHTRFDAAVFLPSDQNDLLLALARALRRHREHRGLPVIIASADEGLLDRCISRDGFDAILADDIESDLPHRLELTARRARLASSIRSFLRSAEGRPGADGAASPRFFAHHAVQTFRRANETGKPISLIALTLAANGSARSGDALSAAIRTTSKLVRAEDLTAKLSANALVVLVRGARQAEAERIAARLEGVIAGTALRSASDVRHVAVGAVERRPEDGIEPTIASLFRSMRENRARDGAAL